MAASGIRRATSANRLLEIAITRVFSRSDSAVRHAGVTAGSARSDLLRTSSPGRCRCKRSCVIMGLLLAPGIRASRISITTSVRAMVSAASLRAVTMWPGYQEMAMVTFAVPMPAHGTGQRSGLLRDRSRSRVQPPRTCCNSPDSYISIMMSEPPTNSPFT